MIKQRFYRVGASAAVSLASLLLTACGQSRAPDCGKLSVDQPWVRTAPAGAKVMAAYFTLANKGDTKVTVNGVASSQFERAELHRTVVNDNGQTSMQPLAKVTVAGGESVKFKPGGRHVMLFNPSQHYAAGDQVELILACGTQHAELPAAAVVRAGHPSTGGENDASARGSRNTGS